MTEELFHHGVKGMKWGVRKAHRGLPGTYKSTSKKKTLEKIPRLKQEKEEN